MVSSQGHAIGHAANRRKPADLQALHELQERLAPLTLARERTHPAPEALQPLFPFGGPPQGHTIGFDGPGSWSVGLALAGAALGEQGWMAVVGIEELGLPAAADHGVRLDRLLMIASPPSDQLAAVVATLIGTVDLVALAPHRRPSHHQARRLAALCREQATTLLLFDGGRHWPLPLDLRLTTTVERWDGIGQGHGHLRQRLLTVTAVGRRASARSRQVSVLAPGPNGGLAPAPAQSPAHQLHPEPAAV